MTTVDPDLHAVLTDQIVKWGIATGDLASVVASSLLEDSSLRSAAEGIGNGGRLGVLRDAAVAVAEIAEADPEEWAREEYLHGHDRKPPRRRKRAPMTTEGEAA
jgi:hypothetical protein